jgi:hypothetical protein
MWTLKEQARRLGKTQQWVKEAVQAHRIQVPRVGVGLRFTAKEHEALAAIAAKPSEQVPE